MQRSTRETTTRSPSSALLPFLGEGSPTKIDYRKKGTLILTSPLEDLDQNWHPFDFPSKPKGAVHKDVCAHMVSLAAWVNCGGRGNYDQTS